MRSRKLSLSIQLVVVTLILSVLSFIPAQHQAAASSPCDVDVITIGARGSGQLHHEGPSGFAGYGPQAAEIAQKLEQELRADGRSVRHEPLLYAASGAIDWFLGVSLFINTYTSSRDGGVSMLQSSKLEHYKAACGHRTPTFVLIGFSQGADVMRTMLARSDAAGVDYSSIIGGIALIGDPKFDPNEPITKIGDYDGDEGKLGTLALPAQYHDPTVSLCDDKDWVCSPGLLENNSSAAHTDSYRGGRSAQAAEFLAEAVNTHLAAKASAPSTTQSYSNLPLECGVTVPYVSTYDTFPFQGSVFKHGKAIDLPAPSGTEVLAPVDGIAHVHFDQRGYGHYVDIVAPNGDVHRLAHMRGDGLIVHNSAVVRGQRVGLVGSTGASTGPHLHYEVRRGPGQIYIDLQGPALRWGAPFTSYGDRRTVHALRSTNCVELSASSAKLQRANDSRTVWFIDGDKRYAVPNAAVVECLGGWDQIAVVTPSQLAKIPADTRQASCIGQMIRVDVDVYYIDGDRKRYVGNASTVECLGGWDNVHVVSQSVLDSHATGSTNASCDSELLRGEGDTAVYRLLNGNLFHVPNSATVDCLGGWEQVHTVAPATIAAYPKQERKATCEGAMLRGRGDSAVYTWQNGHLVHIPSNSVVRCYGGWGEVNVVAQSVIANTPKRPFKAACEGQMIRAEGTSSVYLIKDGVRYHVRNAETVACYGGWEAVHEVLMSTLKTYERNGLNASCEGSLIWAAGLLDVFVIADGKKYYVPSSELVACLGGWSDIATVSTSVMQRYETADELAGC